MRRSMLQLVLMVMCGVCPSHSMASSVVFNRDVLFIESRVEIPVSSPGIPPSNVPDGEVQQPPKPDIVTTTQRHQVMVTIRDVTSRDIGWIIDSTDVRDGFGVLFTFEQPEPTKLFPSNDESYYDVMFISSYGDVKAVARNVSPSILAEPLEVNAPVKALLYLKAGTAQSYGLRAGNKVIHTIFPKKPDMDEGEV